MALIRLTLKSTDTGENEMFVDKPRQCFAFMPCPTNIFRAYEIRLFGNLRKVVKQAQLCEVGLSRRCKVHTFCAQRRLFIRQVLPRYIFFLVHLYTYTDTQSLKSSVSEEFDKNFSVTVAVGYYYTVNIYRMVIGCLQVNPP